MDLAIASVTESTLGALPCCGLKNPDHEGRRRKHCWMKTQFTRGLRAKAAILPDGRQAGYIEYLPGEYAWRGVNARGYLFIHCIWIHWKAYQRQGVASTLVASCVADARAAGMDGVAVLARESPWLAGPDLFAKNGFAAVDTAVPDYTLMVLKLNPSAPHPTIKGEAKGKMEKFSRGLTIIRSNQCPYIAKFAGEIAESAVEEFGIEPRIVELKSHREAQNAPTPYAVFAIIHDGRVLADHQISRTRFRNIMRKQLSTGAKAPKPPKRISVE